MDDRSKNGYGDSKDGTVEMSVMVDKKGSKKNRSVKIGGRPFF